MDFGKALEALKKGHTVTRKGWNGKGQFVYLVPADRYVAKTEAAKRIADKDGKVSYRAYFALRTAQGDVSTWVPSVSDCLAEDWDINETFDTEKHDDHAFDAFAMFLSSLLFGPELHKGTEDCDKCSKKSTCPIYAARIDNIHAECKTNKKKGK